MKTISKSRLKARMLQEFREIESGGETLYVTDHGKPVLKIEPLADRRSIFDVFKEFSNSVEISEEALAPEPDEWGDFQ